MSCYSIVICTLAVVSCLLSIIWSLSRWVTRIREDERTFEDCTDDIRAMNTYNSYFLTAVIIFFGYVLRKEAMFVPNESLLMLLCGFIFATFSIFFVPLAKPKGSPVDVKHVKMLWLVKLICSQWVVILCGSGIANAVITKILS